MIDVMKLMSVQKGKTPVSSAGLSITGKVRSINEDFFSIDNDKQLYIVADGLGGHNAGEVASSNSTRIINSLITDEIIEKFRNHTDIIGDALISAVQETHKAISEMSKNSSEYSNMGTTIVLALVIDSVIHIVHVGDSRVYLLKNGHFSRITDDHSYVMALVKEGKMSEKDIRKSPIKNHLLQAIGSPSPIKPEYTKYELMPGDKALLCSDGLWELIEDVQLGEELQRKLPPQDICSRLVDTANNNGGHDNITAVVVESLPVKINKGTYGKVLKSKRK